ncbi:hypothetical protein NP493_1127g01066 [Ridgeia piscesae]|uniref:Uncharacterized protein n=1 Tax=Ridgeia piscesae TaxID=27915 RepID=A0AAD9KHZ1_RIDPI|nr:hypothetical protein NP493_1127g01066 [Ridgeia piscesae]
MAISEALFRIKN